jgi:hypothetical protein
MHQHDKAEFCSFVSTQRFSGGNVNERLNFVPLFKRAECTLVLSSIGFTSAEAYSWAFGRLQYHNFNLYSSKGLPCHSAIFKWCIFSHWLLQPSWDANTQGRDETSGVRTGLNILFSEIEGAETRAETGSRFKWLVRKAFRYGSYIGQLVNFLTWLCEFFVQ